VIILYYLITFKWLRRLWCSKAYKRVREAWICLENALCAQTTTIRLVSRSLSTRKSPKAWTNEWVVTQLLSLLHWGLGILLLIQSMWKLISWSEVEWSELCGESPFSGNVYARGLDGGFGFFVGKEREFRRGVVICQRVRGLGICCQWVEFEILYIW
jgi:hypothetical protein